MRKEGYFYDAMQHAAGFVIEPGRWGKMIMTYRFPFADVQCARIAFRENVLELVRSNCDCCKDKPSRLDCAFCCPSMESAEAFRIERPKDHLYLVEYNDSFPTFLGSWKAVHPASPTTVGGLYLLAHQYWHTEWSAGNAEHLEIVTLSPLKILEQRF